jgi:hypothetical protein
MFTRGQSPELGRECVNIPASPHPHPPPPTPILSLPTHAPNPPPTPISTGSHHTPLPAPLSLPTYIPLPHPFHALSHPMQSLPFHTLIHPYHCTVPHLHLYCTRTLITDTNNPTSQQPVWYSILCVGFNRRRIILLYT